jgi:hypothetical protein
MTFDNLNQYLAAYSKDRELGIIPIPLVAEYLERTPAAVTAMIRAGNLAEIKIGKNRFVSVQSLADRQKKHDDDCMIVKNYLIKQVRKGETAMFYEPVMAQIGLSTTVPADRTKIGIILGDISAETNDQKGRDRCMLSVLVHRKTAGTTRPGDGFFELARHLGYEWDDDDAFVEEQTKRVMRAYS